MKALVARFHRDQGLTTIIVSHDPRDMEGLADSCVRLRDGVIADDAPMSSPAKLPSPPDPHSPGGERGIWLSKNTRREMVFGAASGPAGISPPPSGRKGVESVAGSLPQRSRVASRAAAHELSRPGGGSALDPPVGQAPIRGVFRCGVRCVVPGLLSVAPRMPAFFPHRLG
jgi:energy-coupling factor transporter ATP-binding protein EcfA2